MKKIRILLISVVIGSGAFSQTGFTSAQSTFRDFGEYSMHPLISGYSINSFNSTSNTRGRRYYFDEWVKGEVISSFGKAISNEDYLFNFDKVNNNLLVTKDKKEIIEVNKESIREIHLTEKDATYDFEKVDQISPDRFVEVLVKNDKISLYRTLNTHFVKANYTTNGLTESGNPYDEYVDEPTYFINYKGNFRPVLLKFRSIKSCLKEESKKVKDFYADHINDEIDENYLKEIVVYLNKG